MELKKNLYLLIPLLTLTIALMIMWESSPWLEKTTLWRAGKINSREAWIGQRLP